MKQFESVYTNPKTGTQIIIARGSEEYVKRIAERTQLHPFTVRPFEPRYKIKAKRL